MDICSALCQFLQTLSATWLPADVLAVPRYFSDRFPAEPVNVKRLEIELVPQECTDMTLPCVFRLARNKTP